MLKLKNSKLKKFHQKSITHVIRMTNTTSQQIKAQTEKPKNKSLFSNYLGNSEEARHRIEIFEKILARQKQELSALTGEISISLVNSDGSLIKISGRKGETTPFSAAKQGEHPLTEKAVISKVNGDLFDLHRPLETDSKIELLEFGSKEGQMVFWHSSAHALGECLEILFDGKLTIGPPLETCFYYDADLGEKFYVQVLDTSLRATIRSSKKL